MQKITFNNMSERLIEVLPELKPQYEKTVAWWGDEEAGPHNIYAQVLNPYLISLLNKRDKNSEKKLKLVFAFLEKLTNHPDTKIQNVVVVTVCEYLLHKKAWLEKARKYMGSTTLRLSHEIQDFWQSQEMQRRDDWDDMR